MSEYFAISRIQSYKYSDCGGVLKEALRILPNYDNPNCDPSLSHLNVSLVEVDMQGLSFEKYILKYREDNNVKGRFNTVATNPKNLTNCACQALFAMSPEYINALSREAQIEYYEYCMEFFKSEFPSVYIVAANIHFDETSPHLHVTFLPVVERVNKKTGELENMFSTTKLMPGKDFFPKYQDRFFEFISAKYDGLTRKNKENVTRDYLTPKEYRKIAPLLESYQKQIDTLLKEKEELERKYNRLRKIPFVKYLMYIFSPKNTVQAKISSIDVLMDELQKHKQTLLLSQDKEHTSLDEQISQANTKSVENNNRHFIQKALDIFR